VNTENALIRTSAWLALLLYVASQALLRIGARNGGAAAGRAGAWWLSAAGWAALAAHTGLALHFRYGWSQGAAYDDTARQTAALTGWNSGAGLYINYLFMLLWLANLALARRAGSATEARWQEWLFRGIFLFMLANAGVIFAPPATKWLGIAGCAILLFAWLPRRPL